MPPKKIRTGRLIKTEPPVLLVEYFCRRFWIAGGDVISYDGDEVTFYISDKRLAEVLTT